MSLKKSSKEEWYLTTGGGMSGLIMYLFSEQARKRSLAGSDRLLWTLRCSPSSSLKQDVVHLCCCVFGHHHVVTTGTTPLVTHLSHAIFCSFRPSPYRYQLPYHISLVMISSSHQPRFWTCVCFCFPLFYRLSILPPIHPHTHRLCDKGLSVDPVEEVSVHRGSHHFLIREVSRGILRRPDHFKPSSTMNRAKAKMFRAR